MNKTKEEVTETESESKDHYKSRLTKFPCKQNKVIILYSDIMDIEQKLSTRFSIKLITEKLPMQ